ncbi:hypothetical protein DCCM_0021 [Desulfocucumis palustris]|uniref:Uncharacterized protein n=1 Tax=Desulfocucumis palustris TaxID=1898651 RepID=A0A2L2X6Q8_9FIRM|nr:hypothetical protein [Desulfocucumis palustris]GBF31837.1 hypothetical protein DCCM_0021 [Desulfocucumis palustris]
MPFDDRLKNTQTPHRVYALCKLIQYNQSLTKEELCQYLQPSSLNKNDDVFKNVYDLADKGELIARGSDGNVILNLTDHEMASIDSFRRAIANRAFDNPQLTFCRFTAWYLMRGPEVYSEKSKDLVVHFDREININKDINMYNETNVIGWRTWVCFLGLGFIHNGIVVPNAARRLQDVLGEDRQMERDRPIAFKDFIVWLNQHCPELDYGELSHNNRGQAVVREQNLSLALSAGLRALHDSGKIKLGYVRDARDVWYLESAATHEITGAVSEIVIGRW